MRIAFVTHAGLGELTPSDRLAADELHRRGATVMPLPWSAHCDWRNFHAVVLRATWDYHTRPAAFLDWLRMLGEQRVPLWNPARLAAWNLHKGYLRDLERAGVAIVPTAWISASSDQSLRGSAAAEAISPPSLQQVIRDRGWTDVVVKPAISASSYRTWLIRGPVTAEDESRFSSLLQEGEVMVQPFLETIARDGELSLVFLGGEFSHAVVKRAAPGEFRVQSNYGGSVTRIEAPADLVKQAQTILEAVPGPWLYARVDGCIIEGQFLLVELEMLEPDLFLNYEPEAPARFAGSLQRLLQSSEPCDGDLSCIPEPARQARGSGARAPGG